MLRLQALLHHIKRKPNPERGATEVVLTITTSGMLTIVI